MKRPLWFETIQLILLSRSSFAMAVGGHQDTQTPFDDSLTNTRSHGRSTLFRCRVGGQCLTILRGRSLHQFFRSSPTLRKKHRALVVAVRELLQPDLRLLVGGVQLQRLFFIPDPLLLSGSSRRPSRTVGGRSSTRPCYATSRGVRSRSCCCPGTVPAPPHTR